MAFTRPKAAQIDFDVTNITDPLIRLNSGQSGANDKDIGLVIERGSDTNVALIWDESADEFVIVNTTEDGSTSGNVTISSYANIQAGTLNVATLKIGGVALTSTPDELNALDGVTATVAELNLLDGVTATTTEINYLDGVTSAIQTQIDNISSSFTLAADSGSNDTFTTGETLTIAGGTGIDTTVSDNQISVAIDSTVATLTGSQTLTNKTLTTPVISSISNTGTLTLPTSTGTVALTSDITLSTLSVTSTAAELNILDGVTSTATELNLLDGVTGTLVTEAGTQTLTNKTLTTPIISSISNTGTLTLPTSTGTVALTSDIPTAVSELTNDSGYSTTTGTVTSIAGTGTVNGLTLSGTVTSSGSLTLGGTFTATVGEISDLTATAAELNILDGVTATTAELNILDGVTSTATELNILDGATATTTELNYVDGVTSAIQTQLDAKAPKASPAFTGTATGVNLTLSGDLTVNGTTTTVASTNTVISDNLIELNNGAGSNANDSGIVIERGSTGDNAFIGWDESADKFIVGTTTATGASTGDLTISTGTLVANLEGNVTGNITGDVTGNADTATALATARNIAGQSFDGTGNISIASTDLSDTASIVLTTASQTLTNKTLTTPVISSISNTGTLTLPTSTGTVALTSDISLSTLSITATAAELNILDGVTATASELNILDGVTATTAELNYTDGVTSNIQTQLDAKASLTGSETLTNKTLTSPQVNTNIDLLAQADLRFYDSDSSNYIGFQSPATVTGNILWTLPGSDGTEGQVLSTNGGGTLAWEDPGSGGGSGSSYPNSTFSTVPGTDGDFDLSYNVAQTTQETPFELGGTDAFGVNLGSVFSLMDPIGSIESIDYGDSEAYVGA